MKRPTRRAFLMISLAAVLLATTVGVADARLSARTSDRATVINISAKKPAIGVSVPCTCGCPRGILFNPKAESHKGARGAADYARDLPFEYGIHPTWAPGSIFVSGCIFYAGCQPLPRACRSRALYYNGGSRVGDLPNARVIPATRKYVRKARLRREYRAKIYTGSYQDGIRLGGGAFNERERAAISAAFDASRKQPSISRSTYKRHAASWLVPSFAETTARHCSSSLPPCYCIRLRPPDKPLRRVLLVKRRGPPKRVQRLHPVLPEPASRYRVGGERRHRPNGHRILYRHIQPYAVSIRSSGVSHDDDRICGPE